MNISKLQGYFLRAFRKNILNILLKPAKYLALTWSSKIIKFHISTVSANSNIVYLPHHSFIFLYYLFATGIIANTASASSQCY